jgi:hypothetical protein
LLFAAELLAVWEANVVVIPIVVPDGGPPHAWIRARIAEIAAELDQLPAAG